MTQLIKPHGGTLKELVLGGDRAAELKKAARDLPSWDLTPRQLCDIELLLNGACSPLEGFMTRADYDAVLETMRLADGTLWPMPLVLDVPEATAGSLQPGNRIALRDHEGVLIAVLTVGDVWTPDRNREARLVFGTEDDRHPGVSHLLNRMHPVYVGGALSGIELPPHYDFKKLRETPSELRERFLRLGWTRVAAFHTHNPMHRAHYALTVAATQQAEANLLIHPIVGSMRPADGPGDADHFTRVRCCERIMKRYTQQTTALSLVQIATRMAGPREALWHMLIRRNYGCTHMIIGPDHASPVVQDAKIGFYGPFDAQELIRKHRSEIEIEMIPSRELVFVEERGEYAPDDEVRKSETVHRISGTEFRRRLQKGGEIPDWFSFPEVVEELQRTYPPRHRQGFTVFFTGLSGAGKSTIANALMVRLLESGGRSVTLLDGDIVRKNLSSELGFSREHRDLNILRIGFVASEITKHGGIALCAPIAPYRSTRKAVRDIISPVGGMIEVYVSTPIDVCEERDRKGLYAKARAGIIKQFTGISDPYEPPEQAEVEINTRDCEPDEAVERIILKLESMGYIK